MPSFSCHDNTGERSHYYFPSILHVAIESLMLTDKPCQHVIFCLCSFLLHPMKAKCLTCVKNWSADLVKAQTEQGLIGVCAGESGRGQEFWEQPIWFIVAAVSRPLTIELNDPRPLYYPIRQSCGFRRGRLNRGTQIFFKRQNNPVWTCNQQSRTARVLDILTL